MAHFEIRDEPGGPRHYLDGRPVHAGDFLEVAIHPGCAVNDAGAYAGKLWLGVRYEWDFRKGSPPRLFFVLADQAGGEAGALVSFQPPDRATLRWPVRR